MRLTTRLAIVITFLLVLFFSGAILFERSVSKSVYSLGVQQIGETRSELNHLLDLHGKFIQSYVYDNSSWDEMANFVQKKDTTWFKENVQTPSQKLNIDYLWVFDNNDNLVYTNIKNSSSTLFFDHQALAKTFSWTKSKSYPHFFKKINKEVVELFIAPIQPSADQERNSKPLGFLAVGQIVNNQHLSLLTLNAENTNIELSNKSGVDTFNKKAGDVFISLPLTNENNLSIAYIKLKRNVTLYSAFAKYQAQYNYFFIFFSLSILAILLFFITKYVNSPLNKIFDAISLRSDEPILKVKERKDEFGQLSTLISLFFKQRKLLIDEIDEHKKTESSLRKALADVELSTVEKVKAERADEAKSVFISNISHELRTPMNAVVAISELLIRNNPKEEDQKLLKVLQFSAKQLRTLVRDILDVSKIENNSLELFSAPFDLYQLCNELTQMIVFSAHEKGIQFNFQADESLKNLIIGDSHRINQVLINLLANAVKFTDKGSITFTFKILQQTSDQKIQLYFEVSDTGIGIQENELKFIFDRFYQANSNTEKKLAGTGLGLPLSQKLVELMGGQLEVQSEHQKGTRFYFTLQFTMHSNAAGEVQLINYKDQNNALKGLKVLVAEDNEINAFVLKQFFKQWNVTAVFAENGKVALTILAQQTFDLVLMDVQMPVMDGFEAVQIIRSWPKLEFKRLPIVALTADASKETKDHLLQNGFDIFVSKPFDAATLFQVLLIIKKHQLEQRPDMR